MFKYKQAIIVRTDLGMGKGKIAVQVAHAAILAMRKHLLFDPLSVIDWEDEGMPKIVLKVSSLEELDAIESSARTAKLVVARVADFGLTQIDPDTVTCMAIGPAPVGIVDKVTKDLKLL